MKILVLGASGGCGQWLVKLAAAREHRVVALAQPSTAYDSPPGVDVLRGDVLDPNTLDAALAGSIWSSPAWDCVEPVRAPGRLCCLRRT